MSLLNATTVNRKVKPVIKEEHTYVFKHKKPTHYKNHFFLFSGASAACSMYLDALTKLSKQAQQSSVGTSLDIGKFCKKNQIYREHQSMVGP